MADKKPYKSKGFLLYAEDEELFADLDDKGKVEVLMGLFSYFNRGEIPSGMGDLSRVVFTVLKRNIDRDSAKYRQACERKAESQRRAWRRKKDPEVHNVNNVNNVQNETKTKTETKNSVLVLDRKKDIEPSPVQGADGSEYKKKIGESSGGSTYHEIVEKMLSEGFK